MDINKVKIVWPCSSSSAGVQDSLPSTPMRESTFWSRGICSWATICPARLNKRGCYKTSHTSNQNWYGLHFLAQFGGHGHWSTKLTILNDYGDSE